MPIIANNIIIIGQEEKKPSPVQVAPKVMRPAVKVEPVQKPKVDPDHPLLNVGGKVDDKHSDYLVDMLTN